MKYPVGYRLNNPAGCFSLGDKMKIMTFFINTFWRKEENPAQ